MRLRRGWPSVWTRGRLPARRGFIHPILLAFALAVPSTVVADKGGHGKGHGRGHGKEDKAGKQGDVQRVVVVDRGLVRAPILVDRQGGVSDRFVALDRNRDGLLSLVEWPGSTVSFSRLDRNRDGLVTRTEFFYR